MTAGREILIQPPPRAPDPYHLRERWARELRAAIAASGFTPGYIGIRAGLPPRRMVAIQGAGPSDPAERGAIAAALGDPGLFAAEPAPGSKIEGPESGGIE